MGGERTEGEGETEMKEGSQVCCQDKSITDDLISTCVPCNQTAIKGWKWIKSEEPNDSNNRSWCEINQTSRATPYFHLISTKKRPGHLR